VIGTRRCGRPEVNAAMINALTCDVEDYFHVEGFAKQVSREDWSSYQTRVTQNTRRVLEMLDGFGVKATFFVLGWVADHSPDLVVDIARRGHELAVHGYWHRLVYEQTPEQFKEDISESLKALSRALAGTSFGSLAKVIGYRAPSFSITQKSLWALDVLREMGLQYDTSIFPVHHDRYGIPGASAIAHRLENGLWEFPMGTVSILNKRIPFAGGGYFRLFPLAFTQWAMRRVNREGRPLVFYFHPWELDPGQPRVEGVSITNRFRHHVNIGRTEMRLRRLLGTCAFGPVREVFATELGEQ
jgi:polysaccharide deacetylase family protein (PEP-CTERM system associated)